MRSDARPIKNLHHENVKQSTEGGDAGREAAGSSFVALSADYPHQVYHTRTHTLKLIAHKCAIHNAQQAVSLKQSEEGREVEVVGNCQLADANRV